VSPLSTYRTRRLRPLVMLAVAGLFCITATLPLQGEAQSAGDLSAGDPFDPFDLSSKDLDFGDDESKTADQLTFEASILLDDERPLDARSKLLKALQKDPKDYRAHLLLAGYYMVHVGHFRLALKYVKQGEAVFIEKEGKPPYRDEMVRNQHSRILYLLSQARLSLDDYQGALDVLDEFTSYGYFAEWYPGSRAWILMKLGRLDEGVKEARAGIYGGAETGRTLNMLGILLSMTGDRGAAIEVLKQAIGYEFSLGKLGQPATPLNNIGEVYEEIFNEALAQTSYTRATTLPDGCEHVLPSLNLAKLYLDELSLSSAKRTMDNFEGCVAQFPLRNGEEHRALVHLARGRIALLAGRTEDAITHYRAVLEDRQWFGKIGTSEQDLEAAGSVSLAQALLRHNAVLSRTIPESISESLSILTQRTRNQIEAWWRLRRGRQILIDDLKDIEDLYVRNTDSMLEYPTLGEALSALPRRVLEKRIEIERARDDRSTASTYYALYLAENVAASGQHAEAVQMLDTVIAKARPQFDNALKLRAMTVKLGLFAQETAPYRQLAEAIFLLSRPALRLAGLPLPVQRGSLPALVTQNLSQGPFLLDQQASSVLSYQQRGESHELTLSPLKGASAMPSFKGKGSTIEEALNNLSRNVFEITVE
jgi:tetratricopeptide (TPR) repeat protein